MGESRENCQRPYRVTWLAYLTFSNARVLADDERFDAEVQRAARELAAQSHEMALQALAEAAQLTPAAVAVTGSGGERSHATDELEQIADFVYTRTS